MWPIRSALFVPAHRRDWVGKAIRVSPGAAILDIEDSVPPAMQKLNLQAFDKGYEYGSQLMLRLAENAEQDAVALESV